MAKKTEAPQGLEISRDGGKYTFSWKIMDADYDGGTELYIYYDGKWSGKISPLKGETSYSIDLGSPKPEVQFRVAGKRATYTTTNKRGKKVKHRCSMSKATYSPMWTATRPKAPALTESYSSGKQTVSWDFPQDDSGTQPLSRVVVQTIDTQAPWTNWMGGSVQDYDKAGSVDRIGERASNIVCWTRAWSEGPGGASDPVYVQHAFSTPYVPALDGASVTWGGGITQMSVWGRCGSNVQFPVDKITAQYCITVPAEGGALPAEASWSDGMSEVPVDDSISRVFSVSGEVDDDKAVFVRLKAEHDDAESFSGNIRTSGPFHLKAPTLGAVTNDTEKVTVNVTDNSSVPDSKIAVFFASGSDWKQIGEIPHGQNAGTFYVPELASVTRYAIRVYAMTPWSGIDWNRYAELSKNNALAPKMVTADLTDISGTVRVAFDWTWTEATKATLSWSDHEDAWTSTDAPKTYEIDHRVSEWNISGLESGKTWYIRARLEDEDEQSPWSDAVSVSLSSVPDKPTITLSKAYYIEGETATLSWTYTNADGSPQSYAELAVGDTVIGHTDSGQSIKFLPVSGRKMKLRVQSQSGRWSEWSEETVANVVPVLADNDVQWRGIDGKLTALPVTVKAVPSGNGYAETAVIRRLTEYHISRPDEKTLDGFEGEIIASKSSADGSMTITKDDLIGSLDEDASYRLTLTVKDGYDQSVSRNYDFRVAWEKASVMPTAEAEIDKYANVTKLTVTGEYPAYVSFDIYRLSADQPVLIAKDIKAGETYVDPYPAFNGLGGHRIVAHTAEGNDITADRKISWLDLDRDYGNTLTNYSTLIEFGGETLELKYNVALSGQWDKDFERTVYLGGSVQGDWNPGVTRDITVDYEGSFDDDDEELEQLRDLAVYAGRCHMRTPDGSSFDCNITVQDSNPYDSRKHPYTLTVNVIDPGGLEAVPLADWEAENGLE